MGELRASEHMPRSSQASSNQKSGKLLLRAVTKPSPSASVLPSRHPKDILRSLLPKDLFRWLWAPPLDPSLHLSLGLQRLRGGILPDNQGWHLIHTNSQKPPFSLSFWRRTMVFLRKQRCVGAEYRNVVSNLLEVWTCDSGVNHSTKNWVPGILRRQS